MHEGQIVVRMLGGFTVSVGNGEGTTIQISERARRIWSLIGFLLIHRDRDVSVTELMDILWSEDEDRDDPLSTLQNNVSRARGILSKLGVPDARSLILYRNGSYRWNPRVDTWVDVNAFYDLCTARGGEGETASARIERGLEAMDLYRGDFLPGLSGETWVVPISAYYRSMYMDQCTALVELLEQEQRWLDLIRLCERGLRVEPENEQLNIAFVRALTATGQPEKAVSVYENEVRLLEEKLGVTPSDEMRAVGEAANRALRGGETDMETVRSLLSESEYNGGAMRCDWRSFLAVAQREARNAERLPRATIILMINLGKRDDASLESRRVEKMLELSLRSGDVFTRLNACQFIAMLSEAGEENMPVIIRRLRTAHERRFPGRSFECSFTWFKLTGPTKEKP